MTEFAKQAANLIQEKGRGFIPKVAIVLGSGLSALADKIHDARVYPYSELPGFPSDIIQGHGGNLVLGYLNNVPVACLQGRQHFYQGGDATIMKTMIRTLKLLGCERFIVTNASGGINEAYEPGDLVVLRDHINLQFTNPLVGPNDDEFGPRFIGLEALYDKNLRQEVHETAEELDIKLHEGVYVGVLGPTFETPAEIKMFRQWGGDLTGMSTVPDVIIAHHCGMHVIAIAAITNKAAGMQDQVLSHDVTLAGAKLASEKLIKLIYHFIPRCYLDEITS